MEPGQAVTLRYRPADYVVRQLEVDGRPVPFTAEKGEARFIVPALGWRRGLQQINVDVNSVTFARPLYRGAPIAVAASADVAVKLPPPPLEILGFDPGTLVGGEEARMILAVNAELPDAGIQLSMCGFNAAVNPRSTVGSVLFMPPYANFPRDKSVLSCTAEVRIGDLSATRKVDVTHAPPEKFTVSFPMQEAAPGAFVALQLGTAAYDVPNRWAAVVGTTVQKELVARGGYLTIQIPTDTVEPKVPVRVLYGEVLVGVGTVNVAVPPKGSDWAWPAGVAAAVLGTLGAYFAGRNRKVAVEPEPAKPPPPRPDPEPAEPPKLAAPASSVESPAVPVPLPPEELVEACVKGHGVLVAGALFEASAGAPTGPALLRAVVDELARAGGRDAEWLDSLRATQVDPNPAQLAGALGTRFAPRRQQQAVHAVLTRANPQRSKLHTAVKKIPFAGIMATGWTDLLSGSFARKPSEIHPRDPDLGKSVLAGAPFYLRLGGDLSDPDSFALSLDDLEARVRTNDTFARFLASVWQSSTLLFAGQTVEELEDFLRVAGFRGDGAPRHFALVPSSSGLALQQERMSSRYGVKLLAYNAARGEEEVGAFLHALAAQANARISTSPPTETSRPKIDRVRLTNIGPFESVEVNLAAGWNVLLGNNGVGKSSLLKAIAIGLCGDEPDARKHAAALLRIGAKEGTIELFSGSTVFSTRLRDEGTKVIVEAKGITPLGAGVWTVLGFPAIRGVSVDAPRGRSADGAPTPDVRDLLPLLENKVDRRMDNIKQWLINSEGGMGPEWGRALRNDFFKILQRLMPNVKVADPQVDAKTFEIRVQTIDGLVPLDAVSQGTSSILGWAGTLLQRLYEINRGAATSAKAPAIVLVDEIDAHLHPAWQQALVPTMRELFPNVQIIATTHSPLVVGSLAAEELHVMSRTDDGKPRVQTRKTSFEGFRADQILTSSGAFGLDRARSGEATQEDYGRLALKPTLSSKEAEDLARLEKEIASPQATSDAEQQLVDIVDEAIDQRFKNLTAQQRQAALKLAKRIIRPAAEVPVVETDEEGSG